MERCRSWTAPAPGTRPGAARDGHRPPAWTRTTTSPATSPTATPDTRWSSAFEDDQWVQVDLALRAVLRPGRPGVGAGVRQTYVVQVSADGATWTDAKSVDNTAVPLPFNGGDASLRTEDFPARTARYVRIQCGLRRHELGQLAVVAVRGRQRRPGHRPGAAPAGQRPRPRTRRTRRRTPPTATRGTRWSSEYADDQWIQVDLGASRRVRPGRDRLGAGVPEDVRHPGVRRRRRRGRT